MIAANISPEFIALFRQKADAAGRMTFARFMELALYDPQAGYYRRDQTRVGYAIGTDFFTASTSCPVFGELIVAACVSLLEGQDPRAFKFIEIGAEPDRDVLSGISHPFGGVHTIRLGEPMEFSGRCVVFSNELFDAQPCHRFVFRAGQWLERGVALQDGMLVEIELPAATILFPLPPTAPEGYAFDAPWAAKILADRIADQPWTGLFVACDYGKTWLELAGHCPHGTARAYHRHTQSNELLAHPGEQDLTCHICWDWLSESLATHCFAVSAIESQEAFFVKQSKSYIAATISAEASRFSRKKQALLQLLHPSLLGQKFQVLHARRDQLCGTKKGV